MRRLRKRTRIINDNKNYENNTIRSETADIRTRHNSGITIIALVVTIVVLIILAVIAVNIVFNENGILRKAEQSKDFQANAEASDQAALDAYDQYIAIATWDSSKVDKVTSADNVVVPVPKGYTASSVTGENTVAGGFVIYEGDGEVNDSNVGENANRNQWVWVPVSNEALSNMFVTPETSATLCGSTGVTTNYYSNLRQRTGDTYTLTTPGNNPSGIREPDLVVESGTSYDASTSTAYYSQAGFGSTLEMAQGIVDDYRAMMQSVSKYNGFYVGRYELTGTVDNPTEVSGAVLTANIAGNWYYLYKACRNVVATSKENVQTTMIWGCQYDEIMNWLKNTKFKDNPDEVDTDSSSWGNYYGADVKSSDGSETIKLSSSQTKLDTGITTYTMANNIYDLAGNCYEWTQEAYNTYIRVRRGGRYSDSGSSNPASDRNSWNPVTSDSNNSARPTLYISIAEP